MSQGLIELSNLNGLNGYTIVDNNVDSFNSNQLGVSVSDAGDINGDGFQDVIVGAPGANFDSGAAYLILGGLRPNSGLLDVSQLNGENGFVITANNNGGHLGSSVSSAGDFNGDGIGDLIIGLPDRFFNDPGESFVVFGQTSGFDAVQSVSQLDGQNGFRLVGSNYDGLGSAVHRAGDLNDDGLDDLVIGAAGADTSYVIFGRSSGLGARLNVSQLNGRNGFVINGGASTVGQAGDLNGDGIDDLLLGDSQANLGSSNAQSGASYVIFGRTNSFNASFNVSRLNGANGFTIVGKNNSYLGNAVSEAGDINGDGFDDVIIGSSETDYGFGTGESYVIFGRVGGFGPRFNVTQLTGQNGFTIQGNLREGSFGLSVGGAGDVNGDGFDDVIIGAPAFRYGPAVSYVVFGKASGFAANLQVSKLNGENGFAIRSDLNSAGLGSSVSKAGDLDGDGFDDLIVGEPNRPGSGKSYIIYGSPLIGQLNPIVGTAANDTLQGTVGDDRIQSLGGSDRLLGRAGDDVLVGGLGKDTLNGGKGDDLFVFKSLREGIDRIQDFTVDADQIQLDASGFKGGLVPGALNADEFFVVGSGERPDAQDRIIYNVNSGVLSFDADGSLAGSNSIQFAILKPSLDLIAADFTIVR